VERPKEWANELEDEVLVTMERRQQQLPERPGKPASWEEETGWAMFGGLVPIFARERARALEELPVEACRGAIRGIYQTHVM
jgi:hypothetical protein